MNSTEPSRCLNCQSILQGRFCSNCGQEDRPLKISVWQLMGQFLSGLFNYDGRLARSLQLLFTKPAGLTQAYMEGKRVAYVNPVQFYLFVSAFYFLFTSTFVSPETAELKIENDEASFEGSNISAENQEEESKDEPSFNSFKEYLAHQNTLSTEEKNTDIEIKFVQKYYQLKDKYTDESSFGKALAQEIFRRLPQMLFFALPLLALISKLVFIRRKDVWYIDHLIFTLHLATSLFLVLLIRAGLELIEKQTQTGIIGPLSTLLILGWMAYYFFSFKQFFQKKFWKGLGLFLWNGFWQSLSLLIIFLMLIILAFFNL